MGQGVIRFQADGFLVLADRLVGLALPAEGVAKVVVGVGKIGFQAEAFLVLADRLVNLAFLAEGDCKVVVGVGEIGLQAEASRYWLIASSIWPFWTRASPRS